MCSDSTDAFQARLQHMGQTHCNLSISKDGQVTMCTVR